MLNVPASATAACFALDDDMMALRDMAQELRGRTDRAARRPVGPRQALSRCGNARGRGAGDGRHLCTRRCRRLGLARLAATVIFEALSGGCPTVAAYISIHNMAAWMIDAYGSQEQRERYLPKLVHDGPAGKLLPDRAGRRAPTRRRCAPARNATATTISSPAPKQFISGAGASDLYVTMVRTGGDGPTGISTLVIRKRRARTVVRRERAQDGLERAADARR